LTIDTHHHILPDFFWRETNDSHAPVGGLAPLQWSKEAMISFMDDAGIDVVVMSVSTPGVHLGDSEKARSLARRCNDLAAELVHTRPDRFASFAASRCPISMPLWKRCRTHSTSSDSMVLFYSRTPWGCTWEETLLCSPSSKNLSAGSLWSLCIPILRQTRLHPQCRDEREARSQRAWS